MVVCRLIFTHCLSAILLDTLLLFLKQSSLFSLILYWSLINMVVISDMIPNKIKKFQANLE